MLQTARFTPEQRVELEKRMARPPMPRTDHLADARKMIESPVPVPVPTMPVQYNPVGATTAATQYRGGCGGCNRKG